MICLDVLVLCAVVLLSSSADSYNVHPIHKNIEIEDVYGTHTITKEDSLESEVVIKFDVTSDSYLYVTMYFIPWEHMNNAPIENVHFALYESENYDGCPAHSGCIAERDRYNCNISNTTRERLFVREGFVYRQNYSQYYIHFVPKTNKTQNFLLLINYSMPNFIFKNGDYSVAWLNLPDMKDKGYTVANTMILPSEDDVPRFFENADEINRHYYNDNGKWVYRWKFTYVGGEDIILWYLNDQEIKEREEALQNKYMFMGVILGFVLTQIHLFWRILVSSIKFLKGNRVCVWFVGKFRLCSVIGNSKSKKYHKPGRSCIKKIHEKNKIKFRTSRVAEKNGYIPCGVCCVDK